MSDCERVEIPEHLSPSARRTWCAWCKLHTVDADRVAVPGWIERDEDLRQVRYLTRNPVRAIPPDEIDPCAPTVAALNAGRVVGYMGESVAVTQLEARPLPFPEEAS